MSILNRSYNLGTQYDHGLDFSENTGYYPMPETGGGAIKIYDSYSQPRIIVLDFLSGCFYDISLRDGPSGLYVTNMFKDKLETDNTGGYDIKPSVTFKEDTGEYEKFNTEHHYTHYYLRPINEDNKGLSGYDSNGFPDTIEFNSQLIVDGKDDTYTSFAQDITPNGEIVYGKKLEGRRLQTKFSASQSEFKLIGRQSFYITKDIVPNIESRNIPQTTYEQTFTDNLIGWYTKGSKTPFVCRSNKTTITGSSTLSTGFDGALDSAILLSYTGTLSIPTPVSTVTCRVFLNTTKLFAVNFTATINGVSKTPTLIKTTNGWNSYYFDITSAQSGYPILIHNNDSGTPSCNICDIRIFSGTPSFTSYIITQYHNDMIYNNGKNVLPLI